MKYTFTTIDNQADPTFNQLLAINTSGEIAGYFGNGQSAAHPNKGYTVTVGANGQPTFTNENYTLSVQTQVTGINNAGTTVGFEVDAAGNSYGFVEKDGVNAIDVAPNFKINGGVITEQFLGINDLDQVAGFVQIDTAGDDAGFIFNADTETFTAVTLKNVAHVTSVTATDINDKGQISGFATIGGKVDGFVQNGNQTIVLTGAKGQGWSNINALGLNDAGQVVGSYMDTKGNTEGFLYNINTGSYTSINDPNGLSLSTGHASTVINGINDAGQMVGFYSGTQVGQDGNTSLNAVHGMLINPTASTYVPAFREGIDLPGDKTFNQLLAINNAGEIAGYHGSGLTAQHPNKGYTLTIGANGQATYHGENYDGSTQTQVTGINNAGVTVGFEIDHAGNSLGFVHESGFDYAAALDPNAMAVPINGQMLVNEQFLGINDQGLVAGFYQTDGNGDDEGFIYNSHTGTFTDQDLHMAGVTSITDTDVNDKGWASGFFTNVSQSQMGFIDENGEILTIAGGNGASNVQVLGLNNDGLAVGSFTTGSGNNVVTHGFIYTLATNTFQQINAPDAVGQTVLNGVNDLGQIVGFYMDKGGITHGLEVTNATAPTLGAASALTPTPDSAPLFATLHPGH